jgi:hypothetical protein
VIQNSATTSFGGRVVAGGESGSVAFLELTTGQQVCQRTLAGRSFTFFGPTRATFDPGSDGAYLFDSAHDALVKVTPSCTEAWHYGTGATLAGVAATSATVVGAAGKRVSHCVPELLAPAQALRSSSDSSQNTAHSTKAEMITFCTDS